MFYYVLVMCTLAANQTCMPPQYFNTSAACVRVGNAYSVATGGYSRQRCVQIKRSDVR